ncbi:MAG: YmdB family metallophosphoesterase [Oscillospiraceae bacterium]|nr:YmdB family metallophosphoesterase [Oscillospiraceae bacterium]MBQ4485954.1 YmdB family metallophosphoesterase [Oscillospiraceae bacterium]
MKVLFAGDIVGSYGCEFAEKEIRRIKSEEKIDIIIANGENSSDGNGITRQSFETVSRFSDVITTGNHSFRRREFYDCFDEYDTLLRPANYPDGVAGKGICVIDKGAYSLAVVNIMGTALMQPLDNPFTVIDNVLKDIGTKNILIDIHAECTSEKKAMGLYLDGRVSAVIGTHTHVQTADEIVLPKGTAYITDAGMTGTENSALGVKAENVIEKFRFNTPVKFEEARGLRIFNAVIIDIDEKTGRSRSIKRIYTRESR